MADGTHESHALRHSTPEQAVCIQYLRMCTCILHVVDLFVLLNVVDLFVLLNVVYIGYVVELGECKLQYIQ